MTIVNSETDVSNALTEQLEQLSIHVLEAKEKLRADPGNPNLRANYDYYSNMYNNAPTQVATH